MKAQLRAALKPLQTMMTETYRGDWQGPKYVLREALSKAAYDGDCTPNLCKNYSGMELTFRIITHDSCPLAGRGSGGRKETEDQRKGGLSLFYTSFTLSRKWDLFLVFPLNFFLYERRFKWTSASKVTFFLVFPLHFFYTSVDSSLDGFFFPPDFFSTRASPKTWRPRK